MGWHTKYYSGKPGKQGPKTPGENSTPRVPGGAQVVLWVILYSAACAGMLKNIIKH